jgi:hypothetical protein
MLPKSFARQRPKRNGVNPTGNPTCFVLLQPFLMNQSAMTPRELLWAKIRER